MLRFVPSSVFVAVYDNSLDPLVPENWANESLAILEESMVIGNLVHRDFEDEFAKAGDLVHTRRPGEFKGKRKGTNDNVVVQDATSTDVQVPLNQHLHTSFLIRDGEESVAMKDLVLEYLSPAMLANARFIDQVLLGQVYRFLENQNGSLFGLTKDNAIEYITGTRNVMNKNKAYMDGRNLIWTPDSETLVLQNPTFHQADRLGDAGTALREASIGRKLGFDHYMCQNASAVAEGNTTDGAVNNAAGYPKGHTAAITVDGFSGIIATVGKWVKIAGDNTPYRITAKAETLGNTTSITLDAPLRNAVVDNAVVKIYNAAAVNNAAGYAVGYAKEIVYDGGNAPVVGQAVSFGASATSAVYSVLDVTATTILLDRPLDAAIVDNDAINVGPSGNFNFAFHRNALALVVRPLAMPRAGTGALSQSVSANGLSVRSTITYDGNKQGHLVTLDLLFGIALLDLKLGAVLLG